MTQRHGGLGLAVERPKTRYAKSGELSIAYQIIGKDDRDLLLVPGFVSHVELTWDYPRVARVIRRLATFGRVIIFDKRGVGMSDPVPSPPTLEERMDDVRAVMDAAGSERATLIGFSEGAAMCLLFAASHPERVESLILYGGMARTTEDSDYPWGAPREALLQAAAEWLVPHRDEGAFLEVFGPSLAGDPEERELSSRFERMAASPSMLAQLFLMFLDVDVRSILPSIRVPTLVIHRRGDRAVNVRAGRYLAENIPGAKYVELPGIDHLMYAGDTDAVLDEIQEFVTGTRGVTELDRVLATVMFTDLVGSTARAADVGDRAWGEALESHAAVVRRELKRFGGTEVKTLGDGFLATFDGPARAIRCGVAITSASQPSGLPVKVGLHTGECVMDAQDVHGIAVHIASRVVELAEPGEVLVSSTVKELVAGSGIQFEDRGLHALKGLEDEWRLFAVQREPSQGL